MKKVFLLFLTASLFACSSDDSSETTTQLFNPPIWIQGTWMDNSNPPTGGFKFTSDDLCALNFNTEMCFKGTSVTTQETISDTEYKVSIGVANSTNIYHFKKVSPTQIKYVITEGVELTYNKE